MSPFKRLHPVLVLLLVKEVASILGPVLPALVLPLVFVMLIVMTTMTVVKIKKLGVVTDAQTKLAQIMMQLRSWMMVAVTSVSW
jgi:hypothetical protein